MRREEDKNKTKPKNLNLSIRTAVSSPDRLSLVIAGLFLSRKNQREGQALPPPPNATLKSAQAVAQVMACSTKASSQEVFILF